MNFSRRLFLAGLPAAAAARPAGGAIDRQARVARHNPTLRAFDPLSPLSVGNGEFAFTADLTSLQTFPRIYEEKLPLCTQSQWGWHSFPDRPGGTLRLTNYDTYGRPVGYATSSEGQKALFDWLRENPHRLHLGRIGFSIERPEDVDGIAQTLDLWTGALASEFTHRGSRIAVRTCCHPALDLLAVTVEGALPVVFEFPYAWLGMSGADWNAPARHQTRETASSAGSLDLERTLDADGYLVSIAWQTPAEMRREGPHRFLLRPEGNRLEFVCEFRRSGAARPHLPTARQAQRAASDHWRQFWSGGGAIDLSAAADARARELERRIVLSEYLTAIQCAGSLPPQETGLTCNSWYGKFHLEMHFWHAAHFAVWGRTLLMERSLGWYGSILGSARTRASQQGYQGARWPKMTDPGGRDSPSPIGPLLIWQQPHPIVMAELCYRARPTQATLDRYRDVVMESAEFMASFAHLDPERGVYHLGPPVIPVQENHPPRETWDPTFELEYWYDALEIAQRWRRRLKHGPEPAWEDVRRRLAPLPVGGGVYLADANCPQTFTERNRDHPSMLGALGWLPGNRVDRATMRRTLDKVLAEWRWPDVWGWDFGMVAMTAASLGDPERAVDTLLMDTPKNTWRASGHNWQRANLPVYLPGNGALLAATAHMARLGAFPKAWGARWEGLPSASIY
ncbi:MAG: glycoside hydrolase family 65 [Bryobacteraceae bacterium]